MKSACRVSSFSLAFLGTCFLAASSASHADPASHFVKDGLRFSILEIDKQRSSVTALDRTTGGMFRFTVLNPTLLTASRNSLKICERFDANLAGVTVGKNFAADFGGADPKKPCCTLATDIGGAGRMLGVREHGTKEGLDVMLLDLKRTDSGETLTVRWQYCNRSEKAVNIGPDCIGCSYTPAQDVKLVDGATRTIYTVVGSGNNMLAQKHSLAELKLAPNRLLKTYAKFPAPRSDEITVSLPGVEPLDNVPLAKQ